MTCDVAERCELSDVPTERLEADLCALAAHIDAAVCRWLGLVAEFDRREGWATWECTSCAMWLSWKCGVSSTTAHEHVRVARALTGLPVIRAAFGRGELSYSKVRAMTRVATPAIEADLVEVARESTGAGLERICRAYRRCGRVGDDEAQRVYAERSVSWSHDEDGAFVAHVRLPAEAGELVIQMIETVRAQLAGAESSAGKSNVPRPSLAAVRADALVHAARRVLGLVDEPVGHSAGAEMTVVVAADLLSNTETTDEGHWHLKLGNDGHWQAHGPAGRPFTDRPVTGTDGRGLERLHDELGLHIGPFTNECLWEGPGADLNAIIEYLHDKAPPGDAD
jgi:hypothetical protein